LVQGQSGFDLFAKFNCSERVGLLLWSFVGFLERDERFSHHSQPIVESGTCGAILGSFDSSSKLEADFWFSMTHFPRFECVLQTSFQGWSLVEAAFSSVFVDESGEETRCPRRRPRVWLSRVGLD
jgi:hypothetical protein